MVDMGALSVVDNMLFFVYHFGVSNFFFFLADISLSDTGQLSGVQMRKDEHKIDRFKIGPDQREKRVRSWEIYCC